MDFRIFVMYVCMYVLCLFLQGYGGNYKNLSGPGWGGQSSWGGSGGYGSGKVCCSLSHSLSTQLT